MAAPNIKIRNFILAKAPQHPQNIIQLVVNKFHVTRTTAHRHMRSLIKSGQIIQTGITKNVRYFRADSYSRTFTYTLKPGLDEFAIYAMDFKTIVDTLPGNLSDTISYTFTELVNNAIDHSRGKRLTISSSFKNNFFILSIKDDGIGVFRNIYEYFKLDDLRESILQLTKGKTTTAPNNHSGEGIFFSSQLPYLFEIHANGYHFIRDNKENDWALSEDKTNKEGTFIVMTYTCDSSIDLVDVFKKFQNAETLAFDRTEIIVELSKFKEEVLVSRSQAKRILRNLDVFQSIVLDFKGVRLVGQGFVDEVFRIYKQRRPDLEIKYINANTDVQYMIERSG